MNLVSSIKSVAIYPPIGIARIGNSPEFFYASDLAGSINTPSSGFKDHEGKIKKQVARFRVYGFDEHGKAVQELTCNEATIEWRVHVANVKAAWYEFNNAMDLNGYAIPSKPRNASYTHEQRQQLVIDAGIKVIKGRNESGKKEYELNGGNFFGKEVNLGKIETDHLGRLCFFGGNGLSASKENVPPTTFANNEEWHDDTCDGTIRATVIIGDLVFEATPAMVAVTPPNYGPGLFGVVTMYDVVLDLFIRSFNYPDPTAGKPNFWRHIYPILERLTNTQWVNEGFYMLFGNNSFFDFTDNQLIEKLADPSIYNKPERMYVYNWLRNPQKSTTSPNQIPPFYGDGFGDYQQIALDHLCFTETQYQWMEQWALGNFESSKDTIAQDFESLSVVDQIEALNKAPLEECLGGPFHPGIELTWPLRNAITWEKPFRLNILPEGQIAPLDYGPLLSPAIALSDQGPIAFNGPGSLTRWLGVPWQTDEASCLSGYDTTTYLPLPSFWSVRVPNQVMSQEAFNRLSDKNIPLGQRLKHLSYRQDWLREFGSQYLTKINKMITEWHDLGIVTETPLTETEAMLPNKVWKETGVPFLPESDASYMQVLYAEKAEVNPKNLESSIKKEDKRRPFYGRNQR